MKKLQIIPALVLCLYAFPLRAAEPASRSSVEAKLALESSLEKRVQRVLSEALGTDDVIVIIAAELQEEKSKRPFDFLPGVPEKEKVGEISLSSSLTMVKKLSATLILDRSLPESDSALAKKLAAGLLGLPQEREDLVTVEKMDFRKTRPFTAAELLVPPNLWYLLWTLLAALLGTLTVFSFFKPFVVSARDLVGTLAAKGGGDLPGEKGPGLPVQAAEETAAETETRNRHSADQERKPPFWFITPESVGNLAFILKTRSAEDITIVMSYAPETAAAALAEALYPKSVEALSNLPKVTLMPEERIKGLEAELFSALDYVVGSEDKTLNIVEQLPDAIQNAAIASFSARNPAFSRKLSAGIVRFSDLKNLEPAHAQMLARRVSMRNLALALKNSDLVQPFLDKLSGGMQERFRQELDLTRNPSAETQRAERLRVARELKKMVKEGFMTMGKAAPARAVPARPAAAPAAGVKSAPAQAPAAGQKPASPAPKAP